MRRRQHQLVPQLDDLLDPVGIDDLNIGQRFTAVLGIDFPRLVDDVVHSFEYHFDNVVLRILGDPDPRKPFRLHVVPESQRSYFDFRLLAFEQL